MDDAHVPQPPQPPSSPASEIDPAMISAFVAERRLKQSVAKAILAGTAAAVVGAAIWAAVTVATDMQIGYMAVGVGFLVGYAVRYAGRGIDAVFGYVGALLSFLGCVAGNLFSAVGFVAQSQSVPFFDLFMRLDVSLAVKLLEATFSPMDILFYGIAIYEGYRFSFLRFTPADVRASRA